MKKTIIAIAIILVVIVLTLKKSDSDTQTVTINNRAYRLLVADNNFEWAKGLMGVRKLNSADGMIFIFPDKRPRTFWNQNTLVNLDVYWMADGKILGKSFLPSIEKTKSPVTVSSPGPADWVVELIRK